MTGRGLLDRVERIGNRLPDPVSIFVLLAATIALASTVVARLGVTVAHPVTGEVIAAVDLLTPAGVRRMLTEIVSNFAGFAPLGTVLTVMVGIGVAERTGLFAAVLKGLVMAVPRRLVTPTVVFAGLLSHSAADAGYVILVPLAATLYAALGRHPIAGVAAVFAGIGGGFSASPLLTALDPLLSGLTQEAAQLYDKGTVVLPTANYWFMAASTPLLTLVGWFVSERIVEPRLGPWTGESAALSPLDGAERRGLWAALGSLLAVGAAIAALVLPAGAPLRGDDGGFGPFYQAIVGLMMIAFVVPGVAFGLATRRLASDRDASRMMSETMAAMGTYIVLAFFAAQAIAWFKWSNLGLMLAIGGAGVLKALAFTGLPLLVCIVVLTMALDLIIASASAKWTLLAPVVVPMLMAVGWSPETAQAMYRVGDSVTNMVTPLNYYLPSIVLPVIQRYRPDAGLGTVIAAMLPYAIAFAIAWTAALCVWIALGWPLGPGASLRF